MKIASRSPTDKYGSGTEEEIDIMLDVGKQVFMCFSEKAIAPLSLESKQYARYLSYFQYSSEDEFRKLLFSHLSKYFLSKKQLDDYKSQNVPNLVIRGIPIDDTVVEVACISKFKTDKYINISEYIEKIKQHYNDISEKKIEHTPVLFANQLFPNKLVEIHENVKQIVKSFAEHLLIERNEDFLDLGGLSENAIASMPALGRRNFVGGKNEEEKYDLIYSLSKLILVLLSGYL